MLSKRSAITFVILIGFVSLFADMTYEGARSINGQFLAILGASGTVVGIVSGLGELIGYGFRLVSGYVSDKTGRYWLITFIGYVINLFAVPLLALAGNWQAAACLMVLERFGKAIRNPSRDAMLSYATYTVGRGWGFGLHEAMDQIGACLGPLIVSCVLYYKHSYQVSFAVLLIPALCALAMLIVARISYPRPQDLEVENTNLQSSGFSKNFWLYIAGVCCVGAGFIDFPLIAYHFKKVDAISDVWIPVFFAIAHAADGVSAVLLGRFFDKWGIGVLIGATAVSALFVPLVFYAGFYLALFGVVLWGLGLGAQESIMRAVVANLVGTDKRATAYGLLNIWFGVFWFLGSALIGYLYDISLISLVLFSFFMQLLAIPFFIASNRR